MWNWWKKFIEVQYNYHFGSELTDLLNQIKDLQGQISVLKKALITKGEIEKPKETGTISLLETNILFKGAFPTAEIYLSDPVYTLTSISEAKRFLQQDLLNFKEFKTNEFDCLQEDTLLLTDKYEFKKIKDCHIGDIIIGKGGVPTKIISKWDKGYIPLFEIYFNNGCSLKVSPDHKVFLSDGQEKKVSDLKVGDLLLSCDNLKEGLFEDDLDKLYLKGLHIADGWCLYKTNEFSISGKDGFPKEEQKRWVKSYCERNKIPFRWHQRYISVKNKELNEEFKLCGRKAPNKIIDRMDYTKKCFESILEGLKADSSISNTGTRVYGTTSYKLALQLRIIGKILGKTTSIRKYIEHGGFGKNPIYRVTIREKYQKSIKIIGINQINKDYAFDIETENKGIYLPETDMVVHNCDNFNKALWGYWQDWQSELALGILWISKPYAHALNVAILTDENGKKGVYIIEPQNDKIYEVPENYVGRLIVM